MPNPCHQFMNLYSTAQDKWHTCPVTLDTGTPASWIDEDMLETLDLEPSYQDTADEYLDFSGKTVKSSATVDIPWCSAEGSRKIRTNTFRVAQSAPFSVILGSELLFPEGILMFNKTAWVLSKKPTTKGNWQLPAPQPHP